ncbi:coiled-coil domain-containing protein [Mycoplasmopsis alligatoris]|uniref:M protein repeat protein n=1 Tax=Mycoplasmopsis alligatoris A21JP2 TaxID=747682 RepID=D4XWK1_9BACT|nr:hypothetical protein [Mycoplasmopsis alligatoris]EFF41209.1 M protein repeat protein [Mycoplasmopsis alligatoris A21JP2]
MDETRTAEKYKSPTLEALSKGLKNMQDRKAIIDQTEILNETIAKAKKLDSELAINAEFNNLKIALKEKIDQTNSEKTTDTANLEILKELNTTLEALIQSTTKSKESLEHAQEAVRVKITGKVSEVSTFLESISKTHPDYNSIKNELEEIASSWNNEKADKSKTSGQLTTKLADVEAKFAKAKENKTNLDKELKTLKQKLDEKIKEVTQFNSNINANTDYKTIKDTLIASINTATKIKENNDESKVNIQKALETLTTSHNEQKALYETTKGKIDAEKLKITNKLAEVEEFLNEIGGQDKYKVLELIIKTLKSQASTDSNNDLLPLTDLEKSFTNLSDALNAVKDRKTIIDNITLLEEKLSEATQLTESMKENSDFSEAAETLKQKVESTRNSINDADSNKLNELKIDLENSINTAKQAKLAKENEHEAIRTQINQKVTEISTFIKEEWASYKDFAAIKSDLDNIVKSWETAKVDKTKTKSQLEVLLQEFIQKLEQSRTNKLNKDKEVSSARNKLTVEIAKVQELSNGINTNPDYQTVKQKLVEVLGASNAIKDDKTKTIEEINAGLEALKQSHNTQKQALEAAKQAINSEKEKLVAELEKVNNFITTLENNEKYNTLKDVLNNAKTKPTADSKDETKSKEELIASLQAITSALNDAKESKNQVDEKLTLNEQITLVEKMITSLESNDDYLTNKQKLQAKLDSVKEEKDKPSISSENLKKLSNELKEALQTSKSEKAATDALLTTARGNLDNKITEANSTLTSLLTNTDYAVAKSKLTSAIDEAKATKENNSKSKAELETALQTLTNKIKEATDAKTEKDRLIAEEKAKIDKKIQESKDKLTEFNANPDYATLKKELKQANSKAKEDKDVANTSVTKLTEILSTLDTKLKDVTSQLNDKKQAITSSLNTLKASIEVAQGVLDNLKTNNDYAATKQKLEQEIAKAKVGTDTMSKDELDKLNAALASKTESYKAEKTVIDKKLKQAKSSLDEEIKKVDSLNTTINANTDFAVIKSSLSDLKTTATQFKDNSSKTEQELKTETQRVKDELQKQQGLLDAAKELIKQQQKLINNKLEEVEPLLSQLGNEDKYTSIKQKLQTAKDNATNNIDVDTKTKEELKTLLSELNSAYTTAKNEKVKVDERLNLEAKIKEADDLVQLLSTNNDYSAEKTKLTNVLNPIKTSKDDTTKSLEELKEFANQLNNAIANAKGEKDKVDKLLQAAKDKITAKIEESNKIVTSLQANTDFTTLKDALVKANDKAKEDSHIPSKTQVDLKAILDTLTSEMEKAIEGKAKAEKLISDEKQKIDTKLSEVTNFLKEFNQNPDYTDLKTELNNAHSTADTSKKTPNLPVSKLTEILNKLESKFNELKPQLTNKKQDVQNSLSTLNASISTARQFDDSLNSNTSYISTKQKLVEPLKNAKENNNDSTTKAKLDDLKSKLDAEVQRLKTEKAVIDKEIQELRDKITEVNEKSKNFWINKVDKKVSKHLYTDFKQLMVDRFNRTNTKLSNQSLSVDSLKELFQTINDAYNKDMNKYAEITPETLKEAEKIEEIIINEYYSKKSEFKTSDKVKMFHNKLSSLYEKMFNTILKNKNLYISLKSKYINKAKNRPSNGQINDFTTVKNLFNDLYVVDNNKKIFIADLFIKETFDVPNEILLRFTFYFNLTTYNNSGSEKTSIILITKGFDYAYKIMEGYTINYSDHPLFIEAN